MHVYTLIFLGCGIGGILRYLVSSKINTLYGQSLPFGTLLVNASGSFIMGLLMTIILNKYTNDAHLTDQLKALLLTGLLGGYTTFSTFSIETINLLNNGKLTHAALNILLSVVLSIGLAFVGIMLGKQL